MRYEASYVVACLLAAATLSACNSGVQEETKDAASRDGGADGAADDKCFGVACSGHGVCALLDGEPICRCDGGFYSEGLRCLPLVDDGGEKDTGAVDGGFFDGGMDATHDAATTDAGFDAGLDVGHDAGIQDGGADGGVEKCFVGYSEYSVLTYDNGYARYEEFLDSLASNGLNFTRVWACGYSNWEREDGQACGSGWFETLPFARSGAGGKYDLTAFDPAFFSRLEAFLSCAEVRGINIELTLFDSWGLKSIGQWSFNPWDDDYNVNGLIKETDNCPVHEKFFDLGDSVLAAIQKNYVQKVVQETKKHGNVIYEIMNEPIVCPTESVKTKARAWHAAAIQWIRQVRPDAIIVIVDGAGRQADSCSQPYTAAGTLLDLPGYEMVSPHWGAWGDQSGATCISQMMSFLAPYGKRVVVDDDGCSVKTNGVKIRTFPENQRTWSNDAVDHGASYNHLQDDLYCNYFYLPSPEMLQALGSAVRKCK